MLAQSDSWRKLRSQEKGRHVTLDDAVALIRDMTVPSAASTWADLGCGDGTFTQALATLLPAGSVIHAIDRNASAMRRIPRAVAGTTIITHVGDFTAQPWPFDVVDGVLLANSLHYVRDQPAFIRACALAMSPSAQFLIIEYDTDRPNRWVPFPLSRRALERAFSDAGYQWIMFLGTRPSIYQRAPIYAALVTSAPSR